MASIIRQVFILASQVMCTVASFTLSVWYSSFHTIYKVKVHCRVAPAIIQDM